MERSIIELGQKFAIKDLGKAEFYVGCQIFRDRLERKLRLGQHLYVQTIADRVEVSRITMIPVAVGVVPLSKKNKPQTPEEEAKMRNILYRETVGAQIWASTMTRPHITAAERPAAKLCDKSGEAHRKLAENEGHGTDVRCMEGRRSKATGIGHATCLDTRRSVSGGAVLPRGAMINGFSSTQEVTTIVPSALEYITMEEVLKEVLFLRQAHFIHPSLGSTLSPSWRTPNAPSSWSTTRPAA